MENLIDDSSDKEEELISAMEPISSDFSSTKTIEEKIAKLAEIKRSTKKHAKKVGFFVDASSTLIAGKAVGNIKKVHKVLDEKVKDGVHFGWTAKQEVYKKMDVYPQAMKLATMFVVVLFLSSVIVNSGNQAVLHYADSALGFVLSPLKIIRAWNVFEAYKGDISESDERIANRILTDQNGQVAGVSEGVVLGEKITDPIKDVLGTPELNSENFKIKEMNFGGDIVTVTDQVDNSPLYISEVKSDTLVARTRDKEESKLLISWKTNKLSTSEIEFFKASEPGNVRRIKEDSFGFSHSVILNNLEQGAAYNYVIKVRDRWGNEIEPGHYAAYSGSKKVSTLDLITKALGEIFGWVVIGTAK